VNGMMTFKYRKALKRKSISINWKTNYLNFKKISIMKKIILLLSIFNISSILYAQKEMKYDDMKTFSKGAFETVEFDSYVAKDGHTYKIGDTLKIGRPSSNKTFAFIQSGNGIFNPVAAADASVSGNNTIIRKIYVGGTKRAGFSIYFNSKGVCGICPQYYINAEQAFETKELKSFGLSREDAIAKLKEQKDLLDLGLITKEQFDRIKEELTPIIMKQ